MLTPGRWSSSGLTRYTNSLSALHRLLRKRRNPGDDFRASSARIVADGVQFNCSLRLEAQDVALSRLKHGFESRREHQRQKARVPDAGFFFVTMACSSIASSNRGFAYRAPRLTLPPYNPHLPAIVATDRTMPFVVTENCIKCKYTDCVEVCPVDCFHEGPNFLVIDPDECIDCTLCEPECPINAIYPQDDVPAGQEGFAALNRELSMAWPVITTRKEGLADAKSWEGKPDKLPLLER